jgi:hypothetical protein
MTRNVSTSSPQDSKRDLKDVATSIQQLATGA